MSFIKNCCSVCLGCCCLIPMSWIAFSYFGLDKAISGGLIVNAGTALNTYFANNMLVSVFLGGVMGLVLILLFPLHWLLFYRPDQIGFAVALILPWALCAFISALIFAKNMKEGFLLPLKIGLGWIITAWVLFLWLIPAALGSIGVQLIDGLVQGLAGLPGTSGLGNMPAFLIITLAVLEGSLVGGAFGALAGAIKYKPGEGGSYSPKAGKKEAPKKEEKSYEKF